MGAFRMEMNIILILSISLTGFPIGMLLAKIAEEEIRPGKRYLKFMQIITLISTITILIYFNKSTLQNNDAIALLSSSIFLFLLPTGSLAKKIKK